MKLFSTLPAIFITVVTIVHAQITERLVVVTTIDKSDYFYIPKSAFADSVNAVLFQDKTRRQAKSNKRPMRIYWQSSCTDGDYNLTVTPEQIFFSSSHENPNPNRLFWVIEIDSIQYNYIRKGINQSPPKGFENVSKYYNKSITVFRDTNYKDTLFAPENWNDTTRAKYERYCDMETSSQLRKYFAVLNKYIPDKNKTITLPPKQQGETNAKYFSDFKDEMLDWLPVRFDHPKVQQ